MDIKLINLSVVLEPVWHADYPEINIGINGQLEHVSLSKTTEFFYDVTNCSPTVLTIDFLNKTPADTIVEQNLDKAVIIKSISFFDITDPKFVWEGNYTPEYPEGWIVENEKNGTVLPPSIKNTTYLGFNGRWQLEFTVPVFTWIHKLQNLGWVYPS